MPKTSDIKLISDLTYIRRCNKQLKMDIYLPLERKEPSPAIMFIHGGGWVGLDKLQFQMQAVYFAQRGYVTVCIDYRLSNEALFPAALHDCKHAVLWLQAHADNYGVDPYRIAVAGDSAGGHLSALLALTPGIKELEEYSSNYWHEAKVNLVIVFYGVFDFYSLWKYARKNRIQGTEQAVRGFLGGSPYEVPQRYAMASPINYVNEASPPFLLFHGRKDKSVPCEQTFRFKEKLDNFKVPVETHIIEEEGHAFLNYYNPYYKRTLEIMEKFIHKWFR